MSPPARLCGLLCIAVALTGCALSHTPQLQTTGALSLAAPPPVSALKMYELGLAEGKAVARPDLSARAKTQERARILAYLQAHVSPHAQSHIDTSESWLNDIGDIPLKRMAFAREREMRLKLSCAQSYDDLSSAYVRALEALQ